ncbi:MAG TPA: ROK family protein, partial [Armatimonadota bacterium]|nr:ROK family protein [Armatimonadota bacterium]
LGAPAYLLNDGLTATLAELRLGAGRGARDLLLITLGTGIGCGVVLGGRLQVGSRGHFGRAGHQILQVDGPVHCHCGRRGCWQSLAARDGVLARALAAAERFPESPLTRVMAGAAPDLREVTALSNAGEPAARGVMEETGRLVGIGLANLIKTLAPERVVVGGGIAEGNRALLEAAQRAVEEYGVLAWQRVPVVPAALGKDAGLLGATLLGDRETERQSDGVTA